MGLLTGAINLRRFRVRGELPTDLRARFERSLRLRAHSELDPQGSEDRSVGWVCIDDPYSTELSPDRFLFGEWLTASMRVDTLRVPPSAARPILKKREAELEEEKGRPLNRGERKEMQQIVLQSLRTRVLPQTRVLDFAWKLGDGRLFFWGTSQNAVAEFIELFEMTFELTLEPLGPAAMAVEAASSGQREALAQLVPTRRMVEGFLAADEEQR